MGVDVTGSGMRRILGAAMMIDGVLQAMSVAGLLSTLLDRSLRDQLLAAGHMLAGAGLVYAGRRLLVGAGRTEPVGRNGHVGFGGYVGRNFSSGASHISGSDAGTTVPLYLPSVLCAALALSIIETTWFNWTDLASRAIYTALALIMVFRKTTLPTA